MSHGQFTLTVMAFSYNGQIPGNLIISQTEYLYHRKISRAAGNRIPSTGMFNSRIHVTSSVWLMSGAGRTAHKLIVLA